MATLWPDRAGPKPMSGNRLFDSQGGSPISGNLGLFRGRSDGSQFPPPPIDNTMRMPGLFKSGGSGGEGSEGKDRTSALGMFGKNATLWPDFARQPGPSASLWPDLARRQLGGPQTPALWPNTATMAQPPGAQSNLHPLLKLLILSLLGQQAGSYNPLG